MKKTNVLYWVFTGLFAAVMLLSGVQNMLVIESSVALLSHLGYSVYIIPFLGVAKILGAIAIVIPGYPRLKEWAYAGLFFDLVGATYSGIMTDGLQPPMAGMLIFFGLFLLSYLWYHKRERMLRTNVQAHRTSAVGA